MCSKESLEFAKFLQCFHISRFLKHILGPPDISKKNGLLSPRR